ncbi:MAG: hypothetical protein K2N60_09765 [Oscillospiraceae bacterium]|nr:hypothetical protein [Oscillospiraceae bacterium]
MALFSANPNKLKQIELQNIIFGTDEKKLMVSNEFLDEMTKVYISKRMKVINRAMENLSTTKSPRAFFGYIDSINESLKDLIVLEKYYSFKKPVPTEFKKNLEEKKDKYILAMLNRAWKHTNNKANYDPTSGLPRSPEQFGPILEEMVEFRDQYTEAIFGHVERFYTSVYEHSIDYVEPEPEPEEELSEEEATALAEEGAEGAEAAGTDADDGIQEFMPEDFGDDMMLHE